MGAPRIKVNLTTAQRIWKRDGWRCKACGSDGQLIVDHCVPLCNGGTNDDDNLQTLCATCNNDKAKVERPAQERRTVVALRLSGSGIEQLDALAAEWEIPAHGGRSELVRSLLAEALQDPELLKRARRGYRRIHSRLPKGAAGF